MQVIHTSSDKIDLQKWADLYDILRYPPAIYDELVVEGRSSKDRFAVLGAWKTGCISATTGRHAYTDKGGTNFFFSNRWRADCPVGYRTWNDLARRDAEVAASVPTRVTSDVLYIVARLRRREGFGFIWDVFVLHCVRPKTFPLYDQHVYRAFRWLETDGKEIPTQAPSSWPHYRSYVNWFSSIVQGTALPYWIVDRALWTFGKSLKRHRIASFRPEERTRPPVLSDSDEWVHETTFGGKTKSFWWRFDEDKSVRIKRMFRGSKKPRETVVSEQEMDRLHVYIEDGAWKRLANNVASLKDGSERPGIGRFLVHELGWSATEAQLAGHLGVILTGCGAWEYNERKIGIKHRKLLDDWRAPLASHFRERLMDTTGL